MIFALFLYLFVVFFSFLGYCFCFYYLQNLVVISVILELLVVKILMNHLVTWNSIF